MAALESLPLSALIAAFVVTFMAAAIQGVVGLGFAVISVPILSLVHPSLIPGPQLVLSLPLTVAMFWRERRAFEPRGAAWVLVGRLPGAGLGMALLAVASQRALDVLIGASVLLGVAVLSTRATVRRTPLRELFAGVASGVTGLVSAIGGPPVAFLYRDAAGPTARANLAAIFAVGTVLSLAGRAAAGGMSWADLQISLFLVPAMALGLLASQNLARRVDGARLRWAMLSVSAFAGLGLLLRAALS